MFRLPERHPATITDVLIGFGTAYVLILALVLPPSWRLTRAGVLAPLIVVGFLYCGWVPRQNDWANTWGTVCLCTSFAVRTFELLVFFPAEANVYRLIPVRGTPHGPSRPTSSNGSAHAHALESGGSVNPEASPTSRGKGGAAGGGQAREAWALQAEPVPPPFTLAKFYWASSLFWSWRGIGWNFAPPLSPSSYAEPYTRHSRRSAYLRHRLAYYAFCFAIHDLNRAFTNCSSAAPFFSGSPGAPRYAELSEGQKAVYSICIAARIWFSLELTHVLFSCVFVSIGGVMGWEGELWTPWGWPPLLGSLRDVWKYPGLGTMWSRTWHHYYRRWLYIFGWIGIGENILRLPHSGESARPRPQPTPRPHPSASSTTSTTSAGTLTPTSTPGPTPGSSGRTSPTHPLPTHPTRRRLSPQTLLSNFIKSLVVFALTAWIHDTSSYCVLLQQAYEAGTLARVDWRDALVTTPFFIAQPFGLAVEALVKSLWRGWKARHHPAWSKRRQRVASNANTKAHQSHPSHQSHQSHQSHHSHQSHEAHHGAIGGGHERGRGNGELGTEADVEPAWLVFIERLLGFVWTWTWLGWTAGWFVQGLTSIGLYRRDGGVTQPEYFSLFGGLLYGRWKH